MKKDTIEYLAYILNQAREEELPKAIVFLGAGASASSGIPLTHVIVRHIKMKYKKNPIIKEFVSKNETDYYTIMGALTADERRDLFYFYVTRPKVKINVTNIYLAQMLKEGYIDFVLTVNFDDLLLRACALYNFLPPVYDISNISVPTTSNFREKSVIYLHGQHFGQWLLNKKEELDKSKNDITNIFNEIKNRRTWIVVGYSGQDEIFDQITSLGSFTKEFYWVNYKDTVASQKILDLVGNPDKNAHLLKGYDSDSFFLKLHSELSKLEGSELETPEIFIKPFTFLKSMMDNVKDIEKYDVAIEHKETFKIVRERFENSKSMVVEGIKEIENKIENKLEQEIIDALLNKDFSKVEYYYAEALKNEFFKENVSSLFNLFGIELFTKAQLTNDTNLFIESIEKYKKAIELNTINYYAYYNWGNTLRELGNINSEKKFYVESFDKYRMASELNPDMDIAFNNWGLSLKDLAKMDSDEKLYEESFKKFEKAIDLNSKNDLAYNNWGISQNLLAIQTNNKKLHEESCEKYKKAIELNPKNESAYYNWAISLSMLSNFSENKKHFLLLSKEKAEIAYRLNPDKAYNLACAYALLDETDNALKYLKLSLLGRSIGKEHIKKDKDWDNYRENPEFIELLSKY